MTPGLKVVLSDLSKPQRGVAPVVALRAVAEPAPEVDPSDQIAAALWREASRYLDDETSQWIKVAAWAHGYRAGMTAAARLVASRAPITGNGSL